VKYGYQLNRGGRICSLDLLGGGLDIMATFVINFMQQPHKQTNQKMQKKRRFRDFLTDFGFSGILVLFMLTS